MKYTGERIMPDNGELYSLFKRHLTLYEFAFQFAKDKIVLDLNKMIEKWTKTIPKYMGAT